MSAAAAATQAVEAGSSDAGSGSRRLTEGGSGEDGSGSGATPPPDPPSAPPPPTLYGYDWLGNLRVSIRHGAALRDVNQQSRRSTPTSPPLTGDCGRPPQIVRFEATDADDMDNSCAHGDVLTLGFDRPTDRPIATTRVEIDRLLTFSQELGLDYTGLWVDATTFSITITQVHDTLPPPQLNVAVATLRGPNVPGATHLRHATRYYRRAARRSPSTVRAAILRPSPPYSHARAQQRAAVPLRSWATICCECILRRRTAAYGQEGPCLHPHHGCSYLRRRHPSIGPGWRETHRHHHRRRRQTRSSSPTASFAQQTARFNLHARCRRRASPSRHLQK